MSKRLIASAASALRGKLKSKPRSLLRFIAPPSVSRSRGYSTKASQEEEEEEQVYYERPANEEEAQQNVAVVGGGLTGLTAAYYLAKKLPSSAKITLYESSHRLGGWVRTDRVPVNVNGITGTVSFERGPRALSSLYGDMWRYDDLVLWDLVIHLGLDIKFPPSRPRYLCYRDRLVRMPPSPLYKALCEPLLRQCLPGMMKAFRNYFNSNLAPYLGPASLAPRMTHDMSIGEWLQAVTGGRTVGDNLVSAILHGIYGGNIDRLSVRSVLPKVFAAYNMHFKDYWRRPDYCFMPQSEHLLRNELQKNQAICLLAKAPKGALVHFGEHGMEALPRALAASLQSNPNVAILRNTPVTHMDFDDEQEKITVSSPSTTKLYDRVISTTSSKVLVDSTGDALSSLSDMEFVSIMTVNIWYPFEKIVPPGFGYLMPRAVPRAENPAGVLGVFFDSDEAFVARGDEPRGTKLFVLLGGHHYDYDGIAVPSEDEAIGQAKSALERHLGIPVSTPCHAVASLARDCIPQHNVGHQERLASAEEQLCVEFGGKLVVANGSYQRIGVLGALRNAYDAAKIVADGWLETNLEDAAEPELELACVERSQILCREK